MTLASVEDRERVHIILTPARMFTEYPACCDGNRGIGI